MALLVPPQDLQREVDMLRADRRKLQRHNAEVRLVWGGWVSHGGQSTGDIDRAAV